jgi:hypothetical protein
MLLKTYAQPYGGSSAGIDETEQLVDQIQSYREAFQSFLHLATTNSELL